MNYDYVMYNENARKVCFEANVYYWGICLKNYIFVLNIGKLTQ